MALSRILRRERLHKMHFYFHTGEFPTLLSVIEFKNAGGYTTAFPGMDAVPIAPLGLTEEEQNDLVEFLKTLTGESPPAHLLSKPVPACEASKVPIRDRRYRAFGIRG